MSPTTQQKILNLSKELKCLPDGHNKHLSFLLDKSQIVAIGWNQGWTTHPKAKKLGYRFETIHSELAAILRYRGNRDRLRRLTLVNVRVNRFDIIGMSKPCDCCMDLIQMSGIRKVWYTNFEGKLVKL